jgi:hypothetical protein
MIIGDRCGCSAIKRKWGPALLPAPTAPSEGSAGVRNLVKNPKAQTRSRSWLTSSGVASDRTTPSCEEPDWPTEATTRRITVSFDPSGLAVETEAPGQNRPMFCGPSWVNLSRVPLCPPHRNASNRVALEKIDSSGASYRLTAPPLRRALASPAGGDRTFGHLPLPPAVAGSWRGRDRRPDHLVTMHMPPESQKRKIR